MQIQANIRESVIKGNARDVAKYVKLELDKGTDWSDILQDCLIPSMDEIGQGFSNGSIFLPELIAAGIAMSTAVEVIKESMGDVRIEAKGIIVLGTIFDDLHDIGKSIVKMNFEMAGFTVVDLGTDVEPEKFITACRESKADLLGMSAMLSTTMWNLKTAIEQIREVNPSVKIMVGGNPITAQFAEEVNADGFAPDGYLAVKKGKELLGID
jgi:5-methyltetrahydrofolate--homocysteine methyltransferase